MSRKNKKARISVCIVGAGPSGLLLARLLDLNGIDSIVLERRSRYHIERRVRAGLLEARTVATLREADIAARLDREALVHEGCEFRIEGAMYRMPFAELSGVPTWIYGQQEIVKDLLAASDMERVWFEVEDLIIRPSENPDVRVSCVVGGVRSEITCDFVIGCDGFHGITRTYIPQERQSFYEKEYPFAWLGILAASPPMSSELVYAINRSGFALQSMRSREVSRLYLSVPPEEAIGDRGDEEIWTILDERLSGGAERIQPGEILERVKVVMRSFIVEPMQYGRIFLVGDAAHVVPPSAAKGLNLAIADARALAESLSSWYSSGNSTALDEYSSAALRRAWQGQEFSAFMTDLLHAVPGESTFDWKIRRARLDRLLSSTTAATAFAEQYTGTARL